MKRAVTGSWQRNEGGGIDIWLPGINSVCPWLVSFQMLCFQGTLCLAVSRVLPQVRCIEINVQKGIEAFVRWMLEKQFEGIPTAGEMAAV